MMRKISISKLSSLHARVRARNLEDEFLKLRIKKSKSGTYYVPSLSMKVLRLISKKKIRAWELSEDEKYIYLYAM